MAGNDFTSLGFPVVFIRKIILGTGQVRLELNMKKLACSSLQDLSDIEIKVILSFDAEITKGIISQTIDPSTDFNTRGDTNHSFGPPGSTTEIRSDQTQQQVFSAGKILIGGSGTLYKTRDTETNDDYYDIPYSATFDVPQLTFDEEGAPVLDLPHLSCLVFPFRRGSSALLDGTEPYLAVGRINIDTVFDEPSDFDVGTLNTPPGLKRRSSWIPHPEALGDGNSIAIPNWPWLGELHKMISGTQVRYMVGQYHGEIVGYKYPTVLSTGFVDQSVKDLTGTYLYPRQVSNSKIIDTRILNDIPPLRPGDILTPVENSPSQFSDIFLSVDSHRNVKFLFGFDCAEVYRRQHQLHPSLRPEVRRASMKRMKIVSMKISRHNMDDRDDVEVIIQSEDSPNLPRKLLQNKTSETIDFGPFVSEKLRSQIDETYLSALHLPDQPLTAPAYRFFSVTDNGTALLGGRYGYSVEIEIEDKTTSFLEEKFNELKDAIDAFRDYMATAEKDSNINHSLDRFRQRYWDDVDSRQQKADFLEHIVNTYLISLSIFSDVDTENLAFNILNMIHPASGNVTGLYAFRDMCVDLRNKLRRLLPVRRSKNDSPEDAPSESLTTNPEFSVYTIKKEFFRPEETYDASCLKTLQSTIAERTGEVFYKYMEEKTFALSTLDALGSAAPGPRPIVNFPGQVSPGLVTFSKEEWERRIVAESDEYSVPSEGVLIEGGHGQFTFSPQDRKSSFLSPLDKLVYRLDPQGPPQAPSRAIITNEFNSILPILPSAFLALLGFDAEQLLEDASDYTSDEDDLENSQIDDIELAAATTARAELSGFAGAENLMMLLALEASSINGEPDNQTKLGDQRSAPRKKTNAALNLGKETNIINTMDSNELNDIPNQIMTLVSAPPPLFSDDTGNFVRNYSNEFEFHMRYNHLQRIEILVGFGTSIKDEIWKTLTDVDVEGMPEVGGHLARMRPYTSNRLGIRPEPRCSVYNEYFFIGKPQTPIVDALSLMNIRIFDPIQIRNDFVLPEYLGHYAENLLTLPEEEVARQELLNLYRINTTRDLLAEEGTLEDEEFDPSSVRIQASIDDSDDGSAQTNINIGTGIYSPS